MTQIRPAHPTDAAALARLAEVTFPLACPPDTPLANIRHFLATTLAQQNFDAYLVDADRALLVADDPAHPGELVAWTMLHLVAPTDPDVLAAVTLSPTVELSKCYVRADAHGSGLATQIVEASARRAVEAGALGMWLGVNQQNGRANRFYEKSGFARVGVKRFLVGDRWEDDYVRERDLR